MAYYDQAEPVKEGDCPITCSVMISASHLCYRHGYEGDHPILEYKECFRLRYAHCRETLALIGEAR